MAKHLVNLMAGDDFLERLPIRISWSIPLHSAVGCMATDRTSLPPMTHHTISHSLSGLWLATDKKRVQLTDDRRLENKYFEVMYASG